MKQLLLSDQLSMTDDRIGPPPTREPADLGDLLSTVAERLESGGLLLLSASWARYITPYADLGGPEGSPVMLKAGDWTARVVKGDTWIHWSGPDRDTLWTCEIDAVPIRDKYSPLVEGDPVRTALNLHQWREATGVGWVGLPGMTGNALLIDGWHQANPKAAEPRWHTSGVNLPQVGGDEWAYGHIEQPYTPAKWQRDHDGPVHGYDLNKAYLSAYQVVELPADGLVRDQAAISHGFRRQLGGIWRVEVEPWPYEHQLPDPAGYAPVLEDGTRWLTTPTLALLEDLHRRGDHGGFAVREAWTAPTRRITRKWAELINDMIGAARDPLDTAARQVYKQTYGMWARRGRVHRPDWHYTIIAQSRANLWRKMDAACRAGHPTLAATGDNGDAPVRVETDCVFYARSDDGHPDNWANTAPFGFRLDPTGIRLGHFKPYTPKGDR